MTDPFPGEDRRAFVARVRNAIGPTGAGAPPAIDESLVRLVGRSDDLVPRFVAAARGAGMSVQECRPDGLEEALRGLLVRLGARRVVVDMGDSKFGAPALRATALLERLDAGSGPRFDAEAGITDAAGAIAETGSLVMAGGAGRARASMLVPPVHIAVVGEEQIVPDLVDAWSLLRAARGSWPGWLVLVSGPSKTGDIEGIIVTGVHGPGSVHVLLVGRGPGSESVG